MEGSDRRLSGSSGTVIEPLLAIERDDLTGTLEFRARGIRTQLHAVAGEIVDAEGGSLGETLGRLLLRSRRLTEDAFGAVIRRMTDVLLESQVVRFGEVAVDYGFLTADDLDLALTQQVREKIMGCVHRGDGEWRFTSGAPEHASPPQRVVRTRPALVEAARLLPERRIEEILVLREHRFPEIVAPPSVIAAEFELTADEQSVLKDLDGTSSLHFILPTATQPDVPALVAALVLGGGVELRTAPSGAKTGERPIPPTFMTLRRDVQPAAATEALPKLPDVETTASLTGPLGEKTSHATVAARRALNRRASREHLSPTPAEAQERARRAFERLRSDLEMHKPASERRRWPEPTNDCEGRLMAEAAFHRGRLYLRAEEAGMALPGLSRAHELRNEHEYELYMKWAQMLVNDSFRDDARRTEMQALAGALLREDPWCELAFSVLGQCAFHDGKEEAALRFFQRAAHLDPKRLDASRLSDLLEKRTDTGRAVSSPDLRSRVRGELITLLDEVVPQPRPAAPRAPAAVPKRATSAAGAVGTPAKSSETLRPPAPQILADMLELATPRETPYGGLEAVPRPADVAPDSALRASGTVPPASRPPQSSARPGPLERAPEREAEAEVEVETTAPITPPPPSPSPWVPLTLPQLVTQPLEPQPLSVPPPVSSVARARPAPAPAPSLVDVDPALLPGPRKRNAAVVVIGVLAACVAGIAGIAHLSSSSDVPSIADAAVATSSEPVTTPTPSLSPSAEPTSTLASAPPPRPTTSATSSALPTTDAQAPPGSGILRVSRRAYGRRIYVDGHIIGEGGHDLPAPCGPHRVKVGSSGIEKSITIPCGTVLELD